MLHVGQSQGVPWFGVFGKLVSIGFWRFGKTLRQKGHGLTALRKEVNPGKE